MRADAGSMHVNPSRISSPRRDWAAKHTISVFMLASDTKYSRITGADSRFKGYAVPSTLVFDGYESFGN
jgi:hypothetical protein